MARPAAYSGSAEDCSGFLLQCELVLEMQPHLYPNDTSKIAFLISQLNGKALKWADSIWSQHGAVTQSYSAFISHFREVFGKPLTDSSAGEKLYNLKQGTMSIYDYALQFRTLAAVCGWNEQALITTYRQGLEPRVRLQLAACEDTIGLEKFIQHSIRCASHASVSPRTSGPVPSHLITLPIRTRQLPRTSQRPHGCREFPLNSFRATTPADPPLVSVLWSSWAHNIGVPHSTSTTHVVALLDSGSAGNFISGALCRQLRLKTSPSPTVYQINSITGRPLSRKQNSPLVPHPSRAP
ncbi:Retrotransposon-derived protein PEG10 [Anabarilius grahami]|uniref:Retrotransposon-derived protein PEG10 n=1 Tax=Anabarilius grahami TaxID=495550 RepID=A0A3N0YRX6_ANAGA|nr:Retrotransposon-derived protein PEG10 [Anabarilius grahami]